MNDHTPKNVTKVNLMRGLLLYTVKENQTPVPSFDQIAHQGTNPYFLAAPKPAHCHNCPCSPCERVFIVLKPFLYLCALLWKSS